MTGPPARVLLVADTHLGFDLPFHPRVQRRRRGPDFFDSLDRALAPALAGQVDLVIHGGDLFYRSRVPTALVGMAMAPLVRVASAGMPVYLVPGNHERSRIPLHLWAAHPNLHIFDRPRTFLLSMSGGTLALSGFPFARRVRDTFADLVRETCYEAVDADARCLCLHQTVEGAQVGPRNYTFRSGLDVIRASGLQPFSPNEHTQSRFMGEGKRYAGEGVTMADLDSLPPSQKARVSAPGFCAVLSGHIHRAQLLTRDLQGRPLGIPVIYPGSVERTSFAERDEQKAFAILTIGLNGQDRNRLLDVSFVPLPTRPMVSVTLEPLNGDNGQLLESLARRLRAIQPDAVVRIDIRGPHASAVRQALSAATLRELAPPTMNVSLSLRPVRRREG